MRNQVHTPGPPAPYTDTLTIRRGEVLYHARWDRDRRQITVSREVDGVETVMGSRPHDRDRETIPSGQMLTAIQSLCPDFDQPAGKVTRPAATPEVRRG